MTWMILLENMEEEKKSREQAVVVAVSGAFGLRYVPKFSKLL